MARSGRDARRRALRALSTVLIVAGTALAADAAITFAWQEPLTALLNKLRQDRLSDDLAALERAGLTPIETRALEKLHGERRRVAFLARSLKRRSVRGSAVGRIRIPRTQTDYVLVNGSRPGDLRRGPGIYDETPFPGAPGTTAIAGHRTTYGAPFRDIDRLRAGDRVIVEMPYATLTYRVEGHRVVEPSDVGVIRRVRYDRLVLSACHPLYSAARRWVVFARLQDVVQRSSKSSSGTTALPDRRAQGGDKSRHRVPAQRHRMTPTMIEPQDRTMRLRELEQRIARAEYVVEPDVLAVAVLRKLDLGLPRQDFSRRRAGSRSRPGRPARPQG